MNYQDYLSITPEIQEALNEGKPILALESTILSHGMPYPENLEFARTVEKIVRGKGVIPATTAIIDGKLKVGLNDEELELMCKADNIAKASRRDVAVYLTNKQTAATTVATTMLIADLAGVRVFATGGIGGVHRGAQETMDISADLQELANTAVCVVCAGCKSILDIGLTLEYLETYGVPVLGYQTSEFPAFYTRTSGFGVDYEVKDAAEVAAILKTKWNLGLKGGVVVGNPIPEEYSMDHAVIDKAIEQALKMAKEKGIHGKATTPFLLATIKEITGGNSLASNLQLAYNNARVASDIAIELAKL
ncbi:MAG: pseudouridine-5'-phosphate glycosidase [Erysipelotrichaceae bacterium]|nr:pseudouridine-5'-phosphate glycosidase [Erysipelotrichaceae bacterium]